MDKTKKDLIPILFFIIILPVLLFVKRPVTESMLMGQIEAPPESTALPWPLPDGESREKLLTFGMHVTPDPNSNPIMPPERFTGYHTALDLEIFENEIDAVVPVSTICTGDIVFTGSVEGYGGVIIQACVIDNKDVRVLYGHLDFTSFQVTTDSRAVEAETIIAELGDERSAESGHTRKHLHLGIHKGAEIEFLGYVQTEAELQNFIDPLPLFTQ
jgi:hypothetical protein